MKMLKQYGYEFTFLFSASERDKHRIARLLRPHIDAHRRSGNRAAHRSAVLIYSFTAAQAGTACTWIFPAAWCMCLISRRKIE